MSDYEEVSKGQNCSFVLINLEWSYSLKCILKAVVFLFSRAITKGIVSHWLNIH